MPELLWTKTDCSWSVLFEIWLSPFHTVCFFRNGNTRKTFPLFGARNLVPASGHTSQLISSQPPPSARISPLFSNIPHLPSQATLNLSVLKLFYHEHGHWPPDEEIDWLNIHTPSFRIARSWWFLISRTFPRERFIYRRLARKNAHW
jgi:hypothetical protein